MNSADDCEELNGSLNPDQKWLKRATKIAGDKSIDYEEGSSGPHYITKSEMDSSDDQLSGEESIMRKGYEVLSRSPGTMISGVYSGKNGSSSVLQYTQGPDGQLYLTNGPAGSNLLAGSLSPGGSSHGVEEASRKRELRLLKNKEAAKECRRKKKEYVKCLENRVVVLEAQNKTLIDELKALKELYCQKDNKY